MYALCVTVHVRPEHIDAFIHATAEQVQHTRQEVGNIQYEVLQSADDSAHFVIYEVYRSRADFEDHQQAVHCTRWKENTAPLLAQPRSATHGTLLFLD